MSQPWNQHLRVLCAIRQIKHLQGLTPWGNAALRRVPCAQKCQQGISTGSPCRGQPATACSPSQKSRSLRLDISILEAPRSRQDRGRVSPGENRSGSEHARFRGCCAGVSATKSEATQSSAPVPRLDDAPQELEALEVCLRVAETKSRVLS